VAAWAKIAQLHRRQAFDVVHAFWANEAGFVGTVAGRALGIPTVVSLAGGELVGFPELGYGSQLVLAERWQVRAALGLATCVTAGSTYMHALCRRLAPKAAGLRVMSMGVDLARFERRAWPAHSLGLHLLCVGSLVPIKRHGLVLKAFSLLRRAVPSARLTMVGNGPLATEVGEQIDHLGLGEVVTMAGHIDHSRMCDVYAAAHVLVVASLHEAQCMAVLEAAACGRPAIGSSVGALADLHPTGAVAVDGLDAHSLASAIQHTAAEAARLEELGSAAHKLVARHHSLDVATERFATLYSTLADG
jgi:glycosyltransferase involved in cell wall biosynthesis